MYPPIVSAMRRPMLHCVVPTLDAVVRVILRPVDYYGMNDLGIFHFVNHNRTVYRDVFHFVQYHWMEDLDIARSVNYNCKVFVVIARPIKHLLIQALRLANDYLLAAAMPIDRFVVRIYRLADHNTMV